MKLSKILSYIFISNFCFYLIEMMKSNSCKALDISKIRGFQDLFLYLFLMLFFPIIEIILVAYPFKMIFEKVKNVFLFWLLILVIFVVEYFIYVYFTNQKIYNVDAFIKVGIAIVFFLVFFMKDILTKPSIWGLSALFIMTFCGNDNDSSIAHDLINKSMLVINSPRPQTSQIIF